MRPRCSVDVIFTFNVQNKHGVWIPTRISIGSWITLQPKIEGGHIHDATKHRGSTSFEGAYKAKVLKFCIYQGHTIVHEVLVQHAYMHRQLDVEVEDPKGKCNCKEVFSLCSFTPCFHDVFVVSMKVLFAMFLQNLEFLVTR